MSTLLQETNCPECGNTTEGGICLNVNCCTAQDQATRQAARSTAKTSAAAAAMREPRAFTSAGRVD